MLCCAVFFYSLIRAWKSVRICTRRATAFQSLMGHLGASLSFAAKKLATLRHGGELARFLPPHLASATPPCSLQPPQHLVLSLPLSPSLLGVLALAVPLPEMLFSRFFANGFLFPFLGLSSSPLPQCCALTAPSTMAGAATQLPVSSLSLLLPFRALLPIKLPGPAVYMCVVHLQAPQRSWPHLSLGHG